MGSLVKARFVLAAAVIAGALMLGFGGVGGNESRDVDETPVPELRLDANTVPPQVLTALPHIGPCAWWNAGSRRGKSDRFGRCKTCRLGCAGWEQRPSCKSLRTLKTRKGCGEMVSTS